MRVLKLVVAVMALMLVGCGSPSSLKETTRSPRVFLCAARITVPKKSAPSTTNATECTSSTSTSTTVALAPTVTTTSLPPRDALPQDEQAARQEIIDAFTKWGAVGTVSEAAKNLGLIDDPRGVVKAATQAVRNYPYQVSHDAYRVSTVGFVNANEAVVVYDIVLDGSPLFADRVGHAVRVEGTWKITRQTVCNDLALAGAKCSP